MPKSAESEKTGDEDAGPLITDPTNFPEDMGSVEGSAPAVDPASILPPDRRWNYWLEGFVVLGLGLRLFAYLLNFPLWWDESFVAVNLLRRDSAELLGPLDYGQVCPLLFLWVELLSVRLLGFSEWSLRLFPLLCSMGGMILFRIVAGRLLEGRALLLAVGIFAVSVHPIRHAADVKPYEADLLVALILVGIAVEWLRRPGQARWLWALGVFSPFALLLSHPAIFVVGGVGLALGVSAWRTRSWNVRLAWLAYGVLSLAVYAALYVLFTRPQASSASPGMKEMWFHSFPPRDAIGFLRWFAIAHSGDMLAYPCGGERGGSTVSLLACLVGIVVLARRRRGVILGILLAPLALGIVAAGLRLYPYGGPAPHGSAARIMQYAAPSLCLLIGLGASAVFERFRRDSIRDRLLGLTCVGLVVVGIVPQVSGFLHPYRAYQAEAAREFARKFWPEVCRDAEVACLRWDLNVEDWNSIHLGIAVSLCNEAIYSPSRAGPGPRLDRVSSTRPLRCVLGVAPEADSARVVAWLAEMRRTFDLRKRETIRVPINEPGRRPEFERYEVFEFVPKSS